MTVITFIQHDGAESIVDGDVGLSLMETALKHNVPGIDADCGGGAICGTCHCFVEVSVICLLPMCRKAQCWDCVQTVLTILVWPARLWWQLIWQISPSDYQNFRCRHEAASDPMCPPSSGRDHWGSRLVDQLL